MRVLVLEGGYVIRSTKDANCKTITVLNPSQLSVAFTKKALGRNIDIEVICDTSQRVDRFTGYIESVSTVKLSKNVEALRVNTSDIRSINK